MTSSPFRPGSTIEDQLAYYKAQYEQLEVELQEFQTSSKELEAELEKDVEASEKRERKLKEQVETLGYEVNEWKTKCKQSKEEASRAQTSLQKEITGMRETNRTVQMKLRDIEVANDDYERQARHTTSSLEDLESKYNVTIERGVMLEEELRSGEQEREQLRIETQRLRDELSDLRVESEITAEKLRHAEATIERFHTRRHATHSGSTRPLSATSEISALTPPSPTTSTPPPAKSETSGSELHTPPSPPLSDVPAGLRLMSKSTGLAAQRKSILSDTGRTPRTSMLAPRLPRHSRGPSMSATSMTVSSSQRMAPPSRPSQAGGADSLARSGSLYQIKGLIGRMQKIEERVHSVRSKLPPPSRTTPRNSPRAGATQEIHVPATITIRSRKRQSISTAGSAREEKEGENGSIVIEPTKRLSFGIPPPLLGDRPSSSGSRPGSRDSQPSSRASNISHTADNPFVRPGSRMSMGGARTHLGQYANQNGAGERRPRSSLGGNYAATLQARHGHSASVSGSQASDSFATPTSRRITIDKTSIPTPSTAARRQSNGLSSLTGNTASRRPSMGFDKLQQEAGMPPPSERRRKQMDDVGETF